MRRYPIPALLLAGTAVAQDPVTLEPGRWVDGSDWGDPSPACDPEAAAELRRLYAEQDIPSPRRRMSGRALGWDRTEPDRCVGGECYSKPDANTLVLSPDPEVGETRTMTIVSQIEGPGLLTREMVLVPDIAEPECRIEGTGAHRRVADFPGPERFGLEADPDAAPIVPRSGTWRLAEADWRVSDACP